MQLISWGTNEKELDLRREKSCGVVNELLARSNYGVLRKGDSAVVGAMFGTTRFTIVAPSVEKVRRR